MSENSAAIHGCNDEVDEVAGDTPAPGVESEVEQVWKDFWLPIVGRPDGTIDMDQVKRELHDCHLFITEVPKVYMHVTNGRISKPNTTADAVIGEHDALFTYSKGSVVIDREQAEDLLAEGPEALAAHVRSALGDDDA